MNGLARRRFVTIAAGAAAAAASGLRQPSQAASLVSWSGIALGAPARIAIDTGEREEAEALIAACRHEIARLEAIFSLFRRDSAISRLNAEGRLDTPEGDLLHLLSLAGAVHRASGGAFDPTVQPLWHDYAVAHARAGRAGPADAELSFQQPRAGFQHVAFGPDRVSFARPAMAITLNGIAQGYVTDRIVALLGTAGIRNVLVDVGEIRALGRRRSGAGWSVGIAGSDRVLALQDRALATSSTLGTTFDAGGRVGHIIDPRTGRPIEHRRQVTISAPSAALADGLSTAACLLPQRAVPALVGAFADTRVELDLN